MCQYAKKCGTDFRNFAFKIVDEFKKNTSAADQASSSWHICLGPPNDSKYNSDQRPLNTWTYLPIDKNLATLRSTVILQQLPAVISNGCSND